MTAHRNALLVGPGTVADTTADGGHEPYTVTVRLSEPVASLHAPLHLDGPLAWCAYQHAREQGLRLPPITDWAHDFPLPLATWVAPCTRPDPDPRLLAADGVRVWGWACSVAQYRVAAHTTAHVRRKPALEAMSLWTEERRHHLALGPRRAGNAAHQAVWVDQLVWHALGDPDEARRLLTAHLSRVGRMARHGWGAVASVTVEAGGPLDGWQRRAWPDSSGQSRAIRAPYWHESRQMPCTLR